MKFSGSLAPTEVDESNFLTLTDQPDAIYTYSTIGPILNKDPILLVEMPVEEELEENVEEDVDATRPKKYTKRTTPYMLGNMSSIADENACRCKSEIEINNELMEMMDALRENAEISADHIINLSLRLWRLEEIISTKNKRRYSKSRARHLRYKRKDENTTEASTDLPESADKYISMLEEKTESNEVRNMSFNEEVGENTTETKQLEQVVNFEYIPEYDPDNTVENEINTDEPQVMSKSEKEMQNFYNADDYINPLEPTFAVNAEFPVLLEDTPVKTLRSNIIQKEPKKERRNFQNLELKEKLPANSTFDNETMFQKINGSYKNNTFVLWVKPSRRADALIKTPNKMSSMSNTSQAHLKQINESAGTKNNQTISITSTKSLDKSKSVNKTNSVKKTKLVTKNNPNKTIKSVTNNKPIKTTKSMTKSKPIKTTKSVIKSKQIMKTESVTKTKPSKTTKSVTKTKPVKTTKPVTRTTSINMITSPRKTNANNKSKGIEKTKPINKTISVNLAKLFNKSLDCNMSEVEPKRENTYEEELKELYDRTNTMPLGFHGYERVLFDKIIELLEKNNDGRSAYVLNPATKPSVDLKYFNETFTDMPKIDKIQKLEIAKKLKIEEEKENIKENLERNMSTKSYKCKTGECALPIVHKINAGLYEEYVCPPESKYCVLYNVKTESSVTRSNIIGISKPTDHWIKMSLRKAVGGLSLINKLARKNPYATPYYENRLEKAMKTRSNLRFPKATKNKTTNIVLIMRNNKYERGDYDDFYCPNDSDYCTLYSVVSKNDKNVFNLISISEPDEHWIRVSGSKIKENIDRKFFEKTHKNFLKKTGEHNKLGPNSEKKIKKSASFQRGIMKNDFDILQILRERMDGGHKEEYSCVCTELE